MVLDYTRQSVHVQLVLGDSMRMDRLYNHVDMSKLEYDSQLRKLRFVHTFLGMGQRIYCANKPNSSYSQHLLNTQVDILHRDCLDIHRCIYIQSPCIRHSLRKDFHCRNF